MGAQQYSTPVRNARLDAIEATIGPSPILRIFTGSMPANPAAGRTGTILAEMTLPADWMAAAGGGSKALSGTWQDPAANASGATGYFTIFDAAGTTAHIQGLVSQPYAASYGVVTGQQMHSGGNVYRATTGGVTGSATPPTGTGSGIADGTVTWAYAGTLNMAIDNSQIASGQLVTVASFTITDGNG